MKRILKAEIKDAEKYLILLRSESMKMFPLHWDFPGGTLKEGENLDDCLRREINEETSLTYGKARLQNEFEIILDDGISRDFRIYSIEERKGNIKLSKEHKDYKWATKEEILKLKIEPFLKKYLEDKK